MAQKSDTRRRSGEWALMASGMVQVAEESRLDLRLSAMGPVYCCSPL